MTELELRPIATAVGEAWAHELVHSLQTDDREIIGAWPGTLRESRARIRNAVRAKLDLGILDELARVAYVAARRVWQGVTNADPEP